ncbi:MAG: RDD family protein [Myxococcota bacterium]
MRAERHHPEATFAPRRARNHDREYEPAPRLRRLTASALDLANVVSLSVGILLLHFWSAGALFPLWVFSAVVVAWLVLPSWMSGRTLGLRALGLRLIRVDGKPMDLLELAFRELVARGLVCASILSVAAVVPFIESQGAHELPTPTGMWSAVLVFACLNVLFAATSTLVGLLRDDGRSLADVLAKVIVVDADAHARSTLRLLQLNPSRRVEPAEAWRRRENRARLRAFALLEAGCILMGVGLPMLSRIEIRAFDVEARFAEEQATRRLESLRESFERHPEDPRLVDEYERELVDQGRAVEARWIRTRHEEAVRSHDEKEELALRRELSSQPSWSALDRLVNLLTRKGRLHEARDVYQAFVDVEPLPRRSQAFGIWLYQNHFDRQAVRTLRRALRDGADEAVSHAYLGLALERLGHPRAARLAYRKAMGRRSAATPADRRSEKKARKRGL